MPNSTLQRALLVYFRIAMGWTFLYAGLTQLFDPNFTVAAFLSHTKTFHDVFAPLATPAVAPFMTFVVKWGHTLIGLSLVFGLFSRVGGVFGLGLMLIYYLAHLDFPYVESQLNFLMEYHLVYGGVLVYLISQNAGRVWGLDGWLEKSAFVSRHPALRPLMG